MKAVRQSLAAAALAPALLSGCVSMAPKVDVAEPTQARPSAAAYTPVATAPAWWATSSPSPSAK